MPGTYQILLNGQPADRDLYTAVASLEVEESMDVPGAVQLTVPIARSSDGDLVYVSEGPLGPLVNLAVVATLGGGGAPGGAGGVAGGAALGGASTVSQTQCIFDGYVLSHKIHLER